MRKYVVYVLMLFCSCQKNISVDELINLGSIEQLEEIANCKYFDLNHNCNRLLRFRNKVIKQDALAERVHGDTLRKAILSVYGPDDRMDFYQDTNAQRVSNSFGVVALVNVSNIYKVDKDSFALNGRTLMEKKCLCKGEAFASQLSVSRCTGFAIGIDTIITAGHCIKSDCDLQNIRFVFDYKMIDSNTVIDRFESKLILSGSRIIARKNINDLDYAIIKTNEIIPKNRILQLNKNSKLKLGDSVYVIGHPVGLPLKIADNAFVLKNRNSLIFKANLDVYGGSSGSPVINSSTHLVEGVAIRGGVDFVKSGNCYISKFCRNDGCNGIGVVRVSQFMDEI